MSEKEKYVNVADLKRKLRYWCKSRGMSKQGVESLMETVERLPYTVKGKLETTLEVEHVKRGRWKYDKTRDQHFCSVCGNFTKYSYLEEEIMSKHCPECGAEMVEDMDIKPAAKMSDSPAEQLGLAPAT